MKTAFKILTVTTLALLLSIQLASAATYNVSAADILPGETDLSYEFNSGSEHPLEELVLTAFEDEFLCCTFETDPNKQATMEILTRVFADNIFTLAIDANTTADPETESIDPNMFISFYISTEDFNALMTLAEENNETLEQELYEDNTIYTVDIDAYMFIIKDELLVITNTIEFAKELIDSYNNPTTPKLSENSTYQNVSSKFIDGAFLNMYIDPQFIINETTGTYDELFIDSSIMGMEVKEELLAAILGEGISIAQTADGFDFSIYVEGDEEKLTELDLMFDKYNFTPKLYKDISGENLILYTEQSNLSSSLTDTLSTFKEDSELLNLYTGFKDWFTAETGESIDNNLLPLLNGRYLLTLHNADQLLPAVTTVFEVNNELLASALVDRMSDTLQEKWGSNPMYSYQVSTAGFTDFHEHTFNLDGVEIVLSMAVTTGSKLVISTHPNLDEIYRSGTNISDNTAFAELFTNPTETVSSIIYLNFETLFDYITVTMETLEAPTEAMMIKDTLAAPWHDFYSKSYAIDNEMWALGTLRVDVAGFAQYEIFEDFIGPNNIIYGDNVIYEGMVEELENFEILDPELVEIEYCDVTPENWYYNHVSNLSSLFIISGYEDGCFRPGNDITRAEFTKLVVEAADFSGLYSAIAMSDQDVYFNDVDSNEWYAHYINQAAANGFVEGYEDGTYHPNEAITRAEAVQILLNVMDKGTIKPFTFNATNALSQENPTEPFDDVNKADWFHRAVAVAYNAEVVSGISAIEFDPNRNINRAEAAKIIDMFINIY